MRIPFSWGLWTCFRARRRAVDTEIAPAEIGGIAGIEFGCFVEFRMALGRGVGAQAPDARVGVLGRGVDHLEGLFGPFLVGRRVLLRIDKGEAHPGKTMLEVIEVQTGSYLGEDDIVRIEDDFGHFLDISYAPATGYGEVVFSWLDGAGATSGGSGCGCVRGSWRGGPS